MVDGGSEEGGSIELDLAYTPTWIAAAVCFVIFFISLVIDRLLQFLGEVLKRKNQNPLFEALQKVKQELMVLGFISLLLTAFQPLTQRICILESWTRHMLPCTREVSDAVIGHGRRRRRLLSQQETMSGHCPTGKVPLLSLEVMEQLHLFVFILAATHVAFSLFTMVLGGAKIRQWKKWEEEIQREVAENASNNIFSEDQSKFIRERFERTGKLSCLLSWLHSFGKQFYGSVTKWDYTTMRLGFIMTHCKTNQKFNFHKYMMRALESDFRKVIGIGWYLWVFVVVFLLLNISGLHIYFWISSIPLILLLAVGTKLEHIIIQLAHEVAKKHSTTEAELVVKPSDDHFWFNQPLIVYYLIHFIFFQNAFEVAFFFWILTSFGFHSCIMGRVRFLIPRLVIGVIIQLLCSYSTLPLYAIVTQMGSTFKKAIFDEHVQTCLLGWAHMVKKRKALGPGRPKTGLEMGPSAPKPLQELDVQRVSRMEEGRAPNGEEANWGR